MTPHPDVIVIGGGISGTATAYELAKRGVSVTLLEREHVGAMASGWTLAGVRQSGRHVAELPLAIAAVERWQTLSEELEANVEYRQDGNLRLARSEEEVPVIRQVVEDGLRAGLPISYLDGPDAVRHVVPALSPDICGASFCATDGHANNHLTVRAYAQAATRHGATIRAGVHVEALQVAGNRVTGVVTNEGVIEAGVVIVAAGVYTPRLLTPLELDYRITVTHCPVVQTEEVRPMLGPVLGVASGGFAGRQEASGRLRLIGQVEEWTGDQHTADNTAITFAQAQDTINQSLAVLPAIASLRISKMWGGLIDRTPDVIPVLDRVPQYDGLVVGAGFSGHGFGIGPITGEILADLAVSGTSRFDLTPFALARFANTGDREDALQMHG